MSDYKGAAILPNSLPQAKELLAGRGYDADWLRRALRDKGITLCIPDRQRRKEPVPYAKELYKQRHKIEIMLFLMDPAPKADGFFFGIYPACSDFAVAKVNIDRIWL